MEMCKLFFMAAQQTVGGQAVIEGVMMRAKNTLAIAVRRPNGKITVDCRSWFTLLRYPWLKKPFIRGFPVLLETLVNGIKALNYSAQQSLPDEEKEKTGGLNAWHLGLTLALSLLFALGLFVVLPHFFAAGMQWLEIAGDLDSISFHIWDGMFKLTMFIGYIFSISFVPDIVRVFQYHGAEHKTIWAYESGHELTPQNATLYSRLHPRCGTAFLLFVLAISIILFTILVPLLLLPWSPEHLIIKHLYIVGLKFLLMIPVSCIAYELIKFSGKFKDNILCKALCAPGLAMQILTTKEPDTQQLEVAIAALKAALNGEGC